MLLVGRPDPKPTQPRLPLCRNPAGEATDVVDLQHGGVAGEVVASWELLLMEMMMETWYCQCVL